MTKELIVCVEPGLSSSVARELYARIQEYDCELTIERNPRVFASTRKLFDMLILGVKAGERITLRCSGRDASAAMDEAVGILEGRGPK